MKTAIEIQGIKKKGNRMKPGEKNIQYNKTNNT
jgi:hypothetical protein